MRAVLHITWRDLRARLRDRSAITLGLLAPLALITVFWLVTDTDPQQIEAQQIGIVADAGAPQLTLPLTAALTQLEEVDVARVRELDDARAARAAIEDGDVAAALIVTSDGYEVLQGGGIVANAIAQSLAQQTAGLVDEVAIVQAAGGGMDGEQTASRLLAADAPVVLQQAQVRGLDPMTGITAGMAVFFLFFAVQFGILGLLEERRNGTLRRLLAAPVSSAQVLMAKLVCTWLLGMASLGSLLVIARIVLGVELGAPLGVALLVACGAAAATATVTLVVGVTRSEQQASAAQSIVAIGLGMLGGAFFSLANAGGLAAVVTKLTPHYWFIEGIAQLGGGDAWTRAVGPAAGLLAFTVVVGVPGMLLARRAVRA